MDARRTPIRDKARAFGLRLELAASGPVVATGLGLTVAALIVFSGPDATAKASYESLYGYDRTWNAARRMVRVDMGLKVVEKDESTGYLLFEYKSTESGQKVTSGFFCPNATKSIVFRFPANFSFLPEHNVAVNGAKAFKSNISGPSDSRKEGYSFDDKSYHLYRLKC